PPISKQTSQSVNWWFFILKTVIIVYFRLLWHNSQILHENHRVGCRPHIHQSAVGQENIQVVKRLGKYVQRRPCSVVLKLRKWDSNGHPTISLVHTDISPWHPYSTRLGVLIERAVGCTSSSEDKGTPPGTPWIGNIGLKRHHHFFRAAIEDRSGMAVFIPPIVAQSVTLTCSAPFRRCGKGARQLQVVSG